MARRQIERGLFYALQHPMRRRILKNMQGKAVSFPRQIAEEIGEPLGSVGYHVRVLAECGAVNLIDERPARGAMTHIYAFAVEEDWALSYLAADGDEAA